MGLLSLLFTEPRKLLVRLRFLTTFHGVNSGGANEARRLQSRRLGEEAPFHVSQADKRPLTDDPLAGRRADMCGFRFRTVPAAGWLLCLALLMAALRCAAADTNVPPPPPRITVAVLNFEDRTHDREDAHWRYSLPRLLQDQFASVKAIRLLSPAASDYAQRRLDLEAGDAVTAAQARQMGELIEARRVIWGDYQRQDGKWLVTARVLNVANGMISSEFKVASTNWLEVREKLTAQLLDELGVRPGRDELRKLARVPTKSAGAWEWYSKALALKAARKPWPDHESALRKAIQDDSRFAEAYLRLGTELAKQREFDAAGEALRRALQVRPDWAEVHQAWGVMLMAQEKWTEAKKELREAQRLDGEDAVTLAKLGELHLAQGQNDEAISCWKEALQRDPTSALVHAHLGGIYARNNQGRLAVWELQEAERFAVEEADTEQIVGAAYDALQATRPALEHYEKFVVLARKAGGNPALVRQVQQRVQELGAKLKPASVQAAMPKVYTGEALSAALHERLTAEELKLVINPLASNPAMKQVAETTARGATDDLDKARKLFTGVAQRVGTGQGGSRTAAEVFAEWGKPAVAFYCQEYARLYVALARDVGLQAFFVLVDKDASGKLVSHACAAVFANGQAWLVDPSYHWFGAPHQGFKVLDDLQALAAYLCQQQADLPRLRLATKLQPDLAIAQFNLALNLISDQRMNEARLVLETALRLEPNSWLAHCSQGYCAGCLGNWEEAEERLRRSVALNPDSERTRLFLAETLVRRGKLPEAREEFRACVRIAYEPQVKAAALRGLAQLNEKQAGL